MCHVNNLKLTAMCNSLNVDNTICMLLCITFSLAAFVEQHQRTVLQCNPFVLT